MNIIKAAEHTLEHIKTYDVLRDPYGLTLEHAAWMLHGIIGGYIQNEKAHRWLGYAQAMLVLIKIVTLAEIKYLNKEASK